MIARRSRFALFVSLAVLVGMLGVLAFASAPALAALKTTFLRTAPVAINENDAFDATGNIYVPQGGVLKKLDSADAPAEFAGSGLAPYIKGSELTGTPEGPFGSVGSVAVAANGDIYVADGGKGVVDVFESSGVFLEKWTGSNTPGKSFGQLGSVLVNKANGRVYVVDLAVEAIDVFEASGAYLFQIKGAETPQGFKSFFYSGYSVAVDDVSGDVLVALSSNGILPAIVYVFDAAGKYLTTWYGQNTPSGDFGDFLLEIAVDQATGDVLIGDSRHGVDLLDSNGDFLTQLSGVSGAYALGIDEATSEIYAREGIEGNSSVFGFVVLPDVLTDAPSSLRPTTATLSGMVGPAGVKVNGCDFEYGTAAGVYTNTVECANTAQIGKGIGLVPVNSMEVSGLQPDTRYHFRLDAGNANGSSESQDGTFFTSTVPLIEGESLSRAGSAEAEVGALVNAAALSSTYRVEYGTTSAYGSSTPEVSVGDSDAPVSVRARLSGLLPGTEYHFRFVATNALGGERGQDVTFTTVLSQGTTSSALPDGRVYELAAPPRETEDWDVYAPIRECNGFIEKGEFTCSFLPVQASSEGDALAYLGDPVPGGNGSNGNEHGNEFLSTRGSTGGWSSRVISSPPAPGAGSGVLATGFWGFSSDLSVGVLTSFSNDPLTPDASPRCTTLYSHSASDGQVKALFTKVLNAQEECSAPRFVGMSADGSRIEFEMNLVLTPEAASGEESNLYESVGGRLYLVNILPDGKPAGNAKFGSASSLFSDRAVSSDGSRLFWTDLSNGDLYVREDNGTPSAKTVLVSEGGEYWGASADGSLVFFTKGGDLYSFDVNSEQATDLAPGAEAQGVVGTSEDGSYVYYVGHKALKGAGGEALKNSRGSEPLGGEENLYAIHAGVTRFVATLAGTDSGDWIDSIGQGTSSAASTEPVYRSAEVSPDGRGVVFMSERSVTGYDSKPNSGSSCGQNALFESLHSCDEVFVYSAVSGGLSCASCSPTGAPIVAEGGFLGLATGHSHLPRWISGDGTRVFFDSAEPLVPRATSGKLQVYEWEQDDSGACSKPGGCVYLLSSGEQEAYFLDASVSGNDVFFVTRADLVVADKSSSAVIYDARVNGYPPVTSPACSGSGCQGVPPAQPIFATPSSVTYEGIGNFPPQSAPAVKPKAKPPVCKKGFVRKRGKCVKRKVKVKGSAGRSGGRSMRGRK